MRHTISNTDIYARFSQAMARLSCFETAPHLAVAVSGGSDSMALVRLADAWASSCNGKVSALTVDHGLRSNSRQEAETVGAWLDALGVENHLLSWQGEKPKTRIQESARDARYRLMERWCHAQGVLHLLSAHTRNDQAETYLMRQAHASGPNGLAGMSQIFDLRHCRLIRPLLGENKGVLRQFLKEQAADWIEDPSNQNEKFERVRWRNHIENQEISSADLAETAARYGKARIATGHKLSECMASAVALNPLGFARVSLSALKGVSDDLYLRLLGRAISVVGGLEYIPSARKLGSLLAFRADHSVSSMTRGGCQIAYKNNDLLITREQRGLPAPVEIHVGDRVHWDQRFHLVFGKELLMCKGAAILRTIDDADWRAVKLCLDKIKLMEFPAAVRRSLPVIVDDAGLFAVPHMGCLRVNGTLQQKNASKILSYLSFCPLNSLSDMGFTVAYPMKATISVLECGVTAENYLDR